MASEKELILPLAIIERSKHRTERHGWFLLSLVSIIAFWSFVYCEVLGKTGFAIRLLLTDKGHTTPIGLPDRIQRRWGQYSPYFPAGKYVGPPKGCKITQVNILQRHGIRYPNEDDEYDKSVNNLMSAEKFHDSKLEFLKDYEYKLREEFLTPLGAQESFESGKEVFHRYNHLITPHLLPFVRASGKSRVVDSAGNWTVGLAVASKHHIHASVDQILSESVNNTLNNDCPNASQGEEEKNTWLSVFAPPIVKRLQKAAHKANITNQDVHKLMALCPFESLGLEKRSPFCKIFTKAEFADFEYFGDVEKYYKTGYGNPLGPIQGVGYVNELLARLTDKPVHDKTQHNHSLSFPLDRTIYADFTHENSQVAVFAAMGLFDVSEAPDPKKMRRMPEVREWVASRMVPFSGRMVVEKLECVGKSFAEYSDRIGDAVHGGLPTSQLKEKGEYVRIFVNDALQPLEFCGAKKKGRRRGMCTLDRFLESQAYARRNGDEDFTKCYN
ncbi:histidine phosphatase superfamily [Irpex rosettiformis]|uniref:Histidine phosphatase superfamily n=1 Tax=Irpex rosettiformis TaxID=378272 RepID=A0ACB8U0J8_9APHY|nr:histidine phosphatase superfamily [Irpex rosettiformis]